MKTKSTLIISFIVLLLTTACHMRKDSGAKQQLDQNTVVPAGNAQVSDSVTHTPTPQFTPNMLVAPNARPKPVPDTKAPVPPL